MAWKPEQPDHEPDCLDRLLAEVRWEEPRPEAIHRLRGQWRTLMEKRSRRRRRRWFALAVAASIAAIGLMFWEIIGRGAIQENIENNGGPSSLIANHGTDGTKGTEEVVGKNSSIGKNPFRLAPPSPSVLLAASLAPRQPNAYELAMFSAKRRVQKVRRQNTVAAQPRLQAPEVEPSLLDAARTCDSPKLGRWILKERNPARRQELLSVLLSRNDMPSVRIFLDLMSDSRTSDASLSCLAGTSNPPVEILFQCLRNPQCGRQKAAARALGRLDRPEISKQLIAMVNGGTYRHEAMIGLLSSSEAIARQYLAKAERDQMLWATLWNAKRQCQTSFPWRNDYAISRPAG
jgi:hypothetical protein